MSTEDRILDAALRVFLEEGPDATTRRIAQEAGVNEVTLFRRFGTKDNLLVEAMRRNAAQQATHVGPGLDPLAELTAWTRAAAHGLLRVRGLLRATIEVHQRSPELCLQAKDGPIRLRAALVTWMTQLQDRGAADADADIHGAAHLLLDGVFATVMRPDPSLALVPDLDEVVLRYARLVLRSIGALPETPPSMERPC